MISLLYFSHFYVLIVLANELDCDQDQHRGPYLLLNEITGGLFNQWLYLHGSIYQSIRWTELTGGTVIIPNHSYSRKTFRNSFDSENNTYTIPITAIFDIRFTIEYMRKENISTCLYSSIWYKNSKITKNITILPTRENAFEEDGYTPESCVAGAIDAAKSHNISYRNPTALFYAAKNFCGAETPTDVLSNYNRILSRSRYAALGIRFNLNIQTISNKIYSKILDIADDMDKVIIIGLHLRVESDFQNEDSTLQYRLDQYGEQIYCILDAYNINHIIIYLARGDLDPHRYKITNKWLQSFEAMILTQEQLRPKKDNIHHIEMQAAIDAEVLMKLPHFIGCAKSTFSYVISEIRLYHGLPTLMTQKPGFKIFYPLLVPPSSYNWRFMKDKIPKRNKRYIYRRGGLLLK